MVAQRAVSTLTFLWLISLMFRMGLSVPIRAVLDSLTQTPFLLKSLLANFFLVPLVAWGLLAFFQPNPIVSFGFMIVVVFAGAPFGPAFATIAKGDTSLAIGMTIFLAALSVPISPPILAAAFYKMKDGKIRSVRVYCTLNAYNPKVFGCTEATEGVEDIQRER
jgi:bile acid:Na+ symporter, BASS family